MNFEELVHIRQSCRNYDETKQVDDELIRKILDLALLAPSACNSQPYKICVCADEASKAVAKATQGMGMNKFTEKVPVMLVISEATYTGTAAAGSKIKHNDYRSIDIGILSAYITALATENGLSTCILGWFDNKKIRSICELDSDVRLVIAIGYASESDKIREKKRKNFNDVVKFK